MSAPADMRPQAGFRDLGSLALQPSGDGWVPDFSSDGEARSRDLVAGGSWDARSIASSVRDGSVLCVATLASRAGAGIILSRIVRAFADAGREVLLIDADASRPLLAKPFQYQPDEGLVDMVLFGTSAGAAIRRTATDKIRVLTVGSPPVDAVEIWESKELAEILAAFRSEWNAVVVHAPFYQGGDKVCELVRHADALVVAMPASGVDAERIAAHAGTLGATPRVLGMIRAGRESEVGPPQAAAPAPSPAVSKGPTPPSAAAASQPPAAPPSAAGPALAPTPGDLGTKPQALPPRTEPTAPAPASRAGEAPAAPPARETERVRPSEPAPAGPPPRPSEPTQVSAPRPSEPSAAGSPRPSESAPGGAPPRPSESAPGGAPPRPSESTQAGAPRAGEPAAPGAPPRPSEPTKDAPARASEPSQAPAGDSPSAAPKSPPPAPMPSPPALATPPAAPPVPAAGTPASAAAPPAGKPPAPVPAAASDAAAAAKPPQPAPATASSGAAPKPAEPLPPAPAPAAPAPKPTPPVDARTAPPPSPGAPASPQAKTSSASPAAPAPPAAAAAPGRSGPPPADAGRPLAPSAATAPPLALATDRAETLDEPPARKTTSLAKVLIVSAIIGVAVAGAAVTLSRRDSAGRGADESRARAATGAPTTSPSSRAASPGAPSTSSSKTSPAPVVSTPSDRATGTATPAGNAGAPPSDLAGRAGASGAPPAGASSPNEAHVAQRGVIGDDAASISIADSARELPRQQGSPTEQKSGGAPVERADDAREPSPAGSAASARASNDGPENAAAPGRASRDAAAESWGVHVSSFPEVALATGDSLRWIGKQYLVTIVPKEIPGKGLWYRIVLGRFPGKAEAQSFAEDLRAHEGLDYVLVMKIPTR